MKAKRRKVYKPIHRPTSFQLVGYTKEEEKMIMGAMQTALAFMIKTEIENGGLSDSDKRILAYARKISTAWQHIMELKATAQTVKCLDLLDKEIERAFKNSLKMR